MSWKNWGDHPIIVTVSIIAGLAGLAYTIYDHLPSSTQPKSIKEISPIVSPSTQTPKSTPKLFTDSTNSSTQSEIITWNDAASDLTGKLDQDFTYICPPDGKVSNVYGTDIYTIDSSICSAAAHAGMINATDGGKVQIRIRPGKAFYNGTTRYGVRLCSKEMWDSFSYLSKASDYTNIRLYKS